MHGLRHLFAWPLLLISLGLIAGCQKEPPPPTKVEVEEGMKQLNEHRQREWNNQ
jgi:hypothetical protein